MNEVERFLSRLQSCRRLIHAAGSPVRVSIGPGDGSRSDAGAVLAALLEQASEHLGIRGILPVEQPARSTGAEGVVAWRLGTHGSVAAARLREAGSDGRKEIERVHACDPRRAFDVERIRTCDGGPIDVYSRGTDAQPAVLIVLPYGVPFEALLGIAERLPHEYRLIAFEGVDLIGSPEEFDRLPHGIAAVQHAIGAVLDHCGLEWVHLVGICGSAMSAVRFAGAQPERVRSLVLGNGYYPGSEPARRGGVAEMMREVAGNRMKTDVLCRFMRAQDLTRIEPDCPHLTMVPYVNSELLYMFAGASRFLHDQFPGLEEFSGWLAQVACRSLVIVCEGDRIVSPSRSHAVAGMLKHCAKYVDGQGSHLSLLADPSEAAGRAIVDFFGEPAA